MTHGSSARRKRSVIAGRGRESAGTKGGLLLSLAMIEIDRETKDWLTGQARGRFGKIPPERIADLVLTATADGDAQLRKAAFDALVRRYAFARRDSLTAQGPKPSLPSSPLGDYRTISADRKRPGSRPYVTRVRSLTPFVTSCSCADFVRGGLGVCKHGLVVLEVLTSSGDLDRASPNPLPEVELSWDPIPPLSPEETRLLRLRYRRSATSTSPSPDSLGFDGMSPSKTSLGNAAARLAFVRRLVDALETGLVTAEPCVSTLLGEELPREARAAHGLSALETSLATIPSLSRTLYPYQREGLERFLATGRLLLGDDMGLGKTTQAIAACHALFVTGRIERGLLVVPSPLKAQWKREWDATTRAVEATVVDGSPQERAKLYRETKRGFLIVAYEQVLRDLARIQELDPQMLVVDEAARIKNWQTKSAAYVRSLRADYRLVLTGTPMENRFEELATLVDLVDDVVLEPKWRLPALHGMPSEESKGAVAGPAKGARRLAELRTKLAPALLRRIRRDVLSDLPSRTDTRVPVEMSPAQREAHDELMPAIAALLARGKGRALARPELLRLISMLTEQRIVSNGLVQKRFDEIYPSIEHQSPTEARLAELDSPKLFALRTLIDEVVVGQGRKAVVFSQWTRMLRLAEWAVRDRLAAAGKRAAFFTGAESATQRERALAELVDDPSLVVLFSSDAGTTGLNLQHTVSVCVNLELPWNPAVLEQRIGRIHRLGQTSPIDVFNLVSEEGIESRIAQVVAGKKAVFDGLFDGESDEVSLDGEGSLLESARKLVDASDVETALAMADEETDEREDIRAAAKPAGAAEASPSTGDGPETGPSTSPILPNLPNLEVSVLPDGGLRIDVPPAWRPVVGRLFASLARALGEGESGQD